jgi:2-polyprenyl-3-methyl-5-hydroxy-6-metoxy-1,4-benzoquinol methylase
MADTHPVDGASARCADIETSGVATTMVSTNPAFAEMKAVTGAEILARPQLACTLCGGEGSVLHSGLRDRQSYVRGVWTIRQCVDPRCGLMWLDPMPLEEELHKAYESYYTHVERESRDGAMARMLEAMKRGYLANRFGYRDGIGPLVRLAGWVPWLYPGRPPELDLSVMWLDASRKGTLLDIGSGSGWLVEHMNSLGWDAQGLDFDPVAVRNAHARGLKFRLGSVFNQGFAEASFDAVTLCQSIEHVPDPVALVRECLRILRPGGQLVMATPNSASLGHRIFGGYWMPLDSPRHLHLFNQRSMASMIARAGGNKFRIFSTARDANGVFITSRAIRRRGRFDIYAPRSFIDKLAGRAVQLAEMLAMVFNPWWGEDLVAVIEKPSPDHTP